MVKELELLYEMNSKVFENSAAGNVTDEEQAILAENKKLALKVILHAADTSNPTKPWNIAHEWAYRILEEYALQGDMEKRMGLQVQMLNDRDKVNKPNSQIGFIEFIIMPLVVAEVKIFPSWCETSVLLEHNLHCWERLWLEESNPSEEEREKVKERVFKICGRLTDERPISTRGGPYSTAPGRTRRKSHG